MNSIVLDTNILVSAALRANSNPRKILDIVTKRHLIPYYSEEIFNEYAEVLNREKFCFSKWEIEILLDYIIDYGICIVPVRSIHAMVDEKDRIFYDTARTANAILITGNKKHFPDEDFIMSPSVYCEKYLVVEYL